MRRKATFDLQPPGPGSRQGSYCSALALLLGVALLPAPALATPPRPVGAEAAERTITAHALGPSIGLGAGERAAGVGQLRYRWSHLHPEALGWWSLRGSIGSSLPAGRHTVEAGGTVGFRRFWEVPGISLAPTVVGIVQDGDATFAVAPGVYVTPFVMLPDKWGDLAFEVRGVVPVYDRKRHEDRVEVLVTLLFNLTRD